MSDDRDLGRIEISRVSDYGVDDAAALISGMASRQSSSLALYRLARASGTLGDIVVTSFRCAQARCLLLDVFHTPAGFAAYKPPVRFSRRANDASSEAARSTRTTDGERRWIESADLLLPEPLEYWLSCDHVLNAVLTGSQAREAATRREREVLI